MVKVKNPDEIRAMIKDHPMDQRRVFSIAAHIDHGKTTTSDYLLRRAGLMSDADAGEKVMMDSDDEEQERGITIFTSVVMLSYEWEGKDYLFEINDTPGHISFTGEVSRALRGSDGAVILVDALEGVMTQTETNIRLAVGEELCKPVVFINKADRLISELRLPPEEFFNRIDIIVSQVNNYIKKVAPKGLAKDWRVSVAGNSVAVGSAKDGWAFTYRMLQAAKIKPVDIFEHYKADDKAWLREKLPLDDALLQMVIEHLPNPVDGQAVKIPHIWKGDLESDIGKSLVACDRNGPLLGMITKIFIDPRSKRPTLIGRVYSGTLQASETIRLVNRRENQRLKRLGVMEITDLLDVDEIPAGNLFAMYGFICPAGESFVRPDEEITAFEEIVYAAEPVVSRAINAKNPQDIAKLGDVTSKWIMADPTASFRQDPESKRYILAGIDPLQIEILVSRINEQVEIEVSDPVIVYREVSTKPGAILTTKSPNGHNRLQISVEPLDAKAIELIKKGEIQLEQDVRERAGILRDEAGWDAKFARRIWSIDGTNMLIEDTKGVQRLDRIKQYIIQIWEDFCKGSTLAREPLINAKFTITDAKVHTDPAHIGFNEIRQMTLAGLHITYLTSEPKMLEPILTIDVKVPNDYVGEISKLLAQHRGLILDMTAEGDATKISGSIPTAETLGLANEIRSATSGKGFFGYEFRGFEDVPPHMLEETIAAIRERKELPAEIPDPSNWQRFVYKRS